MSRVRPRVEQALRDAVRTRFGVELQSIASERPPRTELGDLAFPVAFELARTLKKAPKTIAVIDPDRCFGAFACSICQAACPVAGCIVEEPDRDGRITLEEYRAAMMAVFVDVDEFDDMFLEVSESLLALADTNGDGRVEAAEFQVLLQARGLSEAECAIAFAHVDADGDGSISLQEYVDAVHDYYTNPAEGTPGSWLYPRSMQLT